MNRTAEVLRARGFNPESGPICPYCNDPAILTNAFIVYGSFKYGNIWLCQHYPRCDAFVGVHKTGPWKDYPLGSMANAALRELRNKTHEAFDKMWKDGIMDRKECYAWLMNITGLEMEDAHIGEFDEKRCKMLIEICNAWK